jgi:dipeptidyl aminopeptidase/acylaminoacyl peptidase
MDGWQARFRVRTVLWTVPASGNRNRALAASNRSGVLQLYGWDVPTNELTQLTDRPTGTTHGRISADGHWAHYLDDQAGDELGHWLRVPIGGGAEPVDLTPDMPRYNSSDLSTSSDGRLLAFTSVFNDLFTVHVMPDPAGGGSGAARAVFESPHYSWTVGFDSSGKLLGIMSSERTGKSRFSLIVVDIESGERVAELWDGPESSLSNVQFSPLAGDSRVVAASDVSGSMRPLIWDAPTGARTDLAPPVAGDESEMVPWDWSPDGGSILLARVANAVQELSIYEVATGGARPLDHPAGMYGFWGEFGNWFTADGNIVAQWQDGTHAPTVVLLNGQTGRLERELLQPIPAPPPSQPLRSVTYSVDEGQPVQAWVAVPEGTGPFPTVIETHGGPEAAQMETFAPRAQSWLDHGFAFMTINYRGSTTFGRAFKEAIWGHPGDLEVRDIVAGRTWLVEQGICRPDEVFITGWSYGGFLTLHSVGTAPGLWAAGMAGIAVADWVSEYEDENDSLRAYDRALFGGPPSEKMEAYVRASPLTYCASVDVPVMIIQGRNDTRCPARQVELYEARMRELGKPIEVIWFEAGHAAGADIERALSHQAAFLEFAQRVLSERRAANLATAGA